MKKWRDQAQGNARHHDQSTDHQLAAIRLQVAPTHAAEVLRTSGSRREDSREQRCCCQKRASQSGSSTEPTAQVHRDSIAMIFTFHASACYSSIPPSNSARVLRSSRRQPSRTGGDTLKVDGVGLSQSFPT